MANIDNAKISKGAHDYLYATGQYVQSVDVIDIAKKKEDDERRQYEQLKKKFEG